MAVSIELPLTTSRANLIPVTIIPIIQVLPLFYAPSGSYTFIDSSGRQKTSINFPCTVTISERSKMNASIFGQAIRDRAPGSHLGPYTNSTNGTCVTILLHGWTNFVVFLRNHFHLYDLAPRVYLGWYDGEHTFIRWTHTVAASCIPHLNGVICC